MNDITIFNNDKFGELQVIMRDGNPWFLAKNICDALGFEKPADAVRGLDDDEKGSYIMRGTPGNPDRTIISEAGLFSLILRSRKPEAKAFKRWVTHDVLPSIRKHGAYMTNEVTLEVLQKPENLITLVEKLHGEMTQRIALEQHIAESAPMVRLAEDFLDDGERIAVADLAKKLRQEGLPFGRDRLFAYMRQEGILCAKKGTMAYNTPTQHYMERGWFELKEQTAYINGEAVFKKTTMVTPKGVKALSEYIHACFA